jgi:hypothetical protein
MSKDWWLHLVAFGDADGWNPSYVEGLGTYHRLKPGPNLLFATAPFGVCLWDVLSPDLPSRAIEVGLGTTTYAVAGRDGHRDMCWVLVTEGDDGPVVQVWSFKDDELAGRFFGFKAEDSVVITAPATGVYMWFHDRFY